MAKSEEQLHSILTTLEACRAALADRADQETAQLVAVAILQLRLNLNQVSDVELKALCDAMLPDGGGPAQRPRDPKSPQGHGRSSPPLLKLVK